MTTQYRIGASSHPISRNGRAIGHGKVRLPGERETSRRAGCERPQEANLRGARSFGSGMRGEGGELGAELGGFGDVEVGEDGEGFGPAVAGGGGVVVALVGFAQGVQGAG